MNYLNNVLNLSIEKFAINFFNKTTFGNLFVEFPSKNVLIFKGKKEGINADIKLKNFLLLKKIVTKGPLGFAESYMDGDFCSSDLTNLLFLSFKN